MEVAQNVGSTLRPTPEMVEVIENVKKFREALRDPSATSARR